MKNITRIIVITIPVLLLIYTGLMFVFDREATITNVVVEWSREFPLIPFLGGLVCGHFWWRN